MTVRCCLDWKGIDVMRTILISESDFYDYWGSCITYDMNIYKIMHNEEVRVGEKIRLLVEERDLYKDILIEDIEYGDGTIWIKYLDDNE